MPVSKSRRWRARSVFGPGPRCALNTEQRAQFKTKLQLQRRPGGLTIATARVGHVLANMLGKDGRLDPSQRTIGTRARVHVSTVKRALIQLKDYGFLTWTRRLVREAAGGWRTEQISNAYCLVVPPCEAHSERPVSKKKLDPVCAASPMTDRENAARQILLLGGVVPIDWRLGTIKREDQTAKIGFI